jgi:hypothetical protein
MKQSRASQPFQGQAYAALSSFGVDQRRLPRKVIEIMYRK